MGKVVKYTGSKLLGEELRRLRGSRSLDDIVEMSRRSPLTSRIHHVSAPTLSQIENGITMPSTEVLYSLSVLYNVSPTRLLHHVVEDRLATGSDFPASRDETKSRLRAELTAGNWYEALALAIHGARLASDPADRVMWQASRGYAMRRLGMRQDAILLLLDCSESPLLDGRQAHIVHLYLAETLGEAGYLKAAADHIRAAAELLPADAAPSARVRLLESRVRLVLDHHFMGLPSQPDALRDGLRWIDEIERLSSPVSCAMALRLRLHRAAFTEHLGNTLVAARDFEAIANDAVRDNEPLVELLALFNLGSLKRKLKHVAAARAALAKAENLAVTLKQPDEAFEVYYELYELSVQTSDGRADYHFKRCLRYWPLVQSMTPNARRFDALLRRESSP